MHSYAHRHVAKHVPGVLFLVRFNTLTGLQASIGVTCSYSSRLFLCALGTSYLPSLDEKKITRQWRAYLPAFLAVGESSALRALWEPEVVNRGEATPPGEESPSLLE